MHINEKCFCHTLLFTDVSVASAIIIKIIYIQSGPKKRIHSLHINVFGINLNEISISGWECNIMFSQQMAQALL